MATVDLQLEEIERALLLTIKKLLPDNLAAVSAEYTAKDNEFFGEMAQVGDMPPTFLPEPVLYLAGHHPYVLERPLTDFPNVVANAYSHPESESDLDQIEEVLTAAYAEIACWDEDEATASRRAKRYAKAIHRCIIQDPTLGGTVLRITGSPEISISNAAPATKDTLTNEVVFFQMARVEFTFATASGVYWS
jgi:hypothetical protein